MFCVCSALWGQTAQPALSLSQTNLYFENDFFASQDRYYTVGLQYSLTFKIDSMVTGQLKLPFTALPKDRYISWSIAQKIFIPADKKATELLVDDRPYAGWLYISSVFQQIEPMFRNALELQIGVVGPGAKGEEVMNYFHEIIGNDPANGWQHQLSNELGLLLAYEHQQRYNKSDIFAGGQMEMFSHLAVSLGNVYTFLSAGGQVRIGKNLPDDFGISRMRPGGERRLPVSDRAGLNDWRFYLYAEVDGRVVLRNIFLDGNTFRESHSVEKIPFVVQLAAGWVLSYKNVEFSYSHVITSKEFSNQPDPHQYASLVFSWSF